MTFRTFFHTKEPTGPQNPVGFLFGLVAQVGRASGSYPEGCQIVAGRVHLVMILSVSKPIQEDLGGLEAVLWDEDFDAFGATIGVTGEDFDEPALVGGFDAEFLPIVAARKTEGTDILIHDSGGAIFVPTMDAFEAGKAFPEVD